MPWRNYLALRNFFDFMNIPSAGEQSRNQNPLWNLRQRLFLVLFERITTTYSSIVPQDCRKLVETIFLVLAVVPLFILVYIHVSFIQTPVNCLAGITKEWPRDGILRIELSLKDQSPKSYGKCFRNMAGNPDTFSSHNEGEFDNEILIASYNQTFIFRGLSATAAISRYLLDQKKSYISNETWNDHFAEFFDYSKKQPNQELEVDLFSHAVWPQQQYLIEYSLEYGFLKLSPSTRENLKIPILIMILDPTDKECFGNAFSRFLLKYVVGYTDVLMSSLKSLVDKDENKGFVRNVVTGDQYRFVNKSLTWTSYVVAAVTMVAFTLSISMLLRYSHHQIFLFIVQLLHVLEFNLNTTFPAASLLTVIFALVGMEAIMSEFFNDSTTAFYIILIVWIADQYDTICCHHPVTKRHWLRFFYLYHFAFYAYDYRFNGQYNSLALFTSWMFIQHSMLYFFHHFELPFMPTNLEDMPELGDDNVQGENLLPIDSTETDTEDVSISSSQGQANIQESWDALLNLDQ